MKYPQDFWNERYSKTNFVYGTQPNKWLQSCITKIPVAGRAFFPAEGEGRNAAYAASLGWDVEAFDFSPSAKDKALKLAEELKVSYTYTIGDLNELHLEKESYDLIVSIFVHMPLGMREKAYKTMLESLKPGGFIILEGFSKEQLDLKSGGPKDENMLFDLDLVEELFGDLEFIQLKKERIQLKEGKGHRGEASVIRIFAQKK